jgi:5'-nucleotidase
MKIFNMAFTGTKINTLYYNDLHSSIKYVDTFLEKQDEFYSQHSDEINLTLCGGDMFLDENSNNEIVARKLGPKTDGISVGNHDLEQGEHLATIIDKYNLQDKFLSTNLKYTKQTPLSSIAKSKIVEKQGEKIGIIGVSPFDFNHITFMNTLTDFIQVKPLDETIKIIKNEVKKLEKNGIDKIFLLAHTGNKSKSGDVDYYKELAKIGGIDVIIGGHDHNQTDRWEVSDRGEPVKIVATGKTPTKHFGENLDEFGILNLEFDNNGTLIKDKCKNSFQELTNNGTPQTGETVFTLDRPLKKANPLYGHSEIGNIIADSNLWYVNSNTNGKPANIALVNAGTIRDNFDDPYVTKADINNALPFTTSTLIKTTLTKKQIIDTLNWCALSTSFGKVSPGMMQVAGLEYTVKPDLKVTSVHILNSDGSIKVDLDKCDDDEKFTVTYDVFLATGVAGLSEMKKDLENDPDIEFFEASRQDALFDYLTTCPKIQNYKQTRIHKVKVPVESNV